MKALNTITVSLCRMIAGDGEGATKLLECIVKTKETVMQAKLNREGRLKNLIDAFSITDKTLVKDKSVLIVDDVSTTGATSEVLAQKLKSAGAKQVYLLTIASVAHKDRI